MTRALLIMLLLATSAHADTFVLDNPAVVDGDGFKLDGQAYRVFGIDAPERGDPEWQAATDAMAALILGQTLTCERKGRSFKRIVARCELPSGRDLGCAMIASGHAVEVRRYSKGRYAGCAK